MPMCPGCDESFSRDGGRPKTTFLSSVKLTCPHCGDQVEHPGKTWVPFVYGFIAVMGLAGILGFGIAREPIWKGSASFARMFWPMVLLVVGTLAVANHLRLAKALRESEQSGPRDS